jgi:hypothetical protein
MIGLSSAVLGPKSDQGPKKARKQRPQIGTARYWTSSCKMGWVPNRTLYELGKFEPFTMIFA